MISVVMGTRPEVIKLMPVVMALRKKGLASEAVCSGQHGDLARHAAGAFGVSFDVTLEPPPGNLAGRLGWFVGALDGHFDKAKTSGVVVQGDTATALAAAVAGFLSKRPVAHVEAGLRTWDLGSPFPEESFRQMISRIAAIHFAPTAAARHNLLSEGVSLGRIFVTGNTIVDAVRLCVGRAVWPTSFPVPPAGQFVAVVTCHRRENWDTAAMPLGRAVARLAAKGVACLVVTHPNGGAAAAFSGLPPPTFVGPPVTYLEMIAMLLRAGVVLTDSGGLIEEAATLGRPAVIFRQSTERMEAVAAGSARLEMDEDRIVAAAELAASGKWVLRETEVFGDGQAAERIAGIICKEWNRDEHVA